jgi:hypothetical protein
MKGQYPAPSRQGMSFADVIRVVIEPLLVYFVNNSFFYQRGIQHFKVLRQTMQVV